MAGSAYCIGLHSYNTRNDPRNSQWKDWREYQQNELYYNFRRDISLRTIRNLTRSFGRFALSNVPLVFAAVSLIGNSNSVGNSVDLKRIAAMSRLRKIQRWWKAKLKLRVPVLTPQEEVYFNPNLWRLILSYTKCPRCKRYRTITAPHAIWNNQIHVSGEPLVAIVVAKKAVQLAKWYYDHKGGEWMFQYDIDYEYKNRLLVGPLDKWRLHKRPKVERCQKFQVCCRSCDPMRLIKEGKRILDAEAFRKVSERERKINLRTRRYNKNRKRRAAPRSRKSNSFRGFWSS